MPQRQPVTAMWDLEELQLIEAGYTPNWDAEDERLVQTLTCTRDGRMLAYVGLCKNRIAIAIGVCPACQSFVTFQGAQQ